MFHPIGIMLTPQVCRTTSTALQVEFMYFISSRALNLPDRARVHFPGTANGEHIDPIDWPSFDASDLWSLPKAKKSEVITQANIIRVSGPTFSAHITDDEKRDADKELEKIRTIRQAEPVFWHATPLILWEQVCKGYSVKD